MPQGKKGVSQQGNRKLKKNLHQSRLEGEKHQTELRSMETSMKEKDDSVKDLRARLTKQDDELKQIRDVAFEFKEIVNQLQTQNGELQSMACNKLTLMVGLEEDNATLKGSLKKKEEIIEANEAQLLSTRQTISNLEKEITEMKANTKQITEDFLIKERLFQTRLDNRIQNEWKLFNTLMEKDKKLHKKNQDYHTAMQVIYNLNEEMETKASEEKAKTEQLMQSFREKGKLLEAELRSKDEMIAGLNEEIERQDKNFSKKNQDYHTAMQVIYNLNEKMETKVAEEKANTEQLMQSFQEKGKLLEAELRSKDEMIAGLNEEIGRQDINLNQKVDEVKVIRELFKDKEQKFEEEMCLHKKQAEAIAYKLMRTTKELGFKRVELDAVASGVKTKVDKLRKADEKLKTYNKRLDGENKKQNFFFRSCNAFCRGKKRVLNDDVIYVVGEKRKSQ